jgi:hypothetical protein
MGKSYDGQLAHEYPVISFPAGNNTIWFNGSDNLLFRRHVTVPVRYNKNNPTDAKVDVFFSIWADTLIPGIIALLLWLIIFLHPDIVPRRSIFLFIGQWPFLRLIVPTSSIER